LTGGNIWVSSVLASAVPGSPNYDAVNDQLLHQGPALLTLDLDAGEGIDPAALLAGADRARGMLQAAAAFHDLEYSSATGELRFTIQNNTGHKLISGFPEGRRMFVNIKAEDETFHFVLATDRFKDNRIPPKGFRIAGAAARLCEPVWHGQSAPNDYTADEYAGGYDAVTIAIPAGVDRIEVQLYYQTTSREYVEFLRDEINGTGGTLSSPTPSGEPEAYIIQTDPFFAQLAAWGDTVWQLWEHNKSLDGAAPVLMTEAAVDIQGGPVYPAIDHAIDKP